VEVQEICTFNLKVKQGDGRKSEDKILYLLMSSLALWVNLWQTKENKYFKLQQTKTDYSTEFYFQDGGYLCHL